MKNFKITWLFVVFFMFSGIGFAQEAQSAHTVDSVQTTFSVEINADTTLKDLKEIEEMLQKNYNIHVTFENVKTIDDKIVAIRMQLINGNQSFMRSIKNSDRAIDPFAIRITKIQGDKYDVQLATNSAKMGLNSLSKNPFSAFDSLSEKTFDFQSEFSNFSEEFEQMYQQMQASQERFQEFFKDFREEAKQFLEVPAEQNEKQIKKEL